MRVLLASPGMGVGGAERVVIDLAHGLASRGHEVLVSGPAGPLDAELSAERVLLRESGRSVAGVADSVARLAREIRGRRPTLVHGHNVKATVVAGAAARLARGPRRPPVVATFHGVMPGEYRAAARLLRAADRVACVSEELAADLARAGLPAERLLVIHNAVAA
ncbi:MAG TPA: glycosyltransferase, partial [Solirubrobacter sp.]|nr:glycosyltransferase [Solirubrobacter sp.]